MTQTQTTVLITSLLLALLFGLLLIADIGRSRRRRDPQRRFTWDQKRRIIAQARGRCEHKPELWRRCTAPGAEADHVVPWSRGGPTELWNSQLLCRRHNLRKSNWYPTMLYRWRLRCRRKRYSP